MTNNRIPLSRLPTELKAATGQELPYRRLYGLVLDARLPMVKQDTNGRYYLEGEDLPALAETLGLTPVPIVPKARSAERLPATVAA